jgi:hypothetical protein
VPGHNKVLASLEVQECPADFQEEQEWASEAGETPVPGPGSQEAGVMVCSLSSGSLTTIPGEGHLPGSPGFSPD